MPKGSLPNSLAFFNEFMTDNPLFPGPVAPPLFRPRYSRSYGLINLMSVTRKMLTTNLDGAVYQGMTMGIPYFARLAMMDR